jgi:hypothetical protein
MAKDIDLILAQLESWKTGYLPPSAQILMSEVHALILEQLREIESLKTDALTLTDHVTTSAKKTRRHVERNDYLNEALEKAADIAFKQWHKWPADEIKAAILELRTSK